MVDFKGVFDRRKAIAAYHAGDFRKAAGMATKLLKQNKNDGELKHTLAMSCMQLGRYDECIAHLNALLVMRPNEPALLSDLGFAHLWSGKFDDAHRAFDKALAIAPNMVHALTGKASTLDREGRYAEVRELLQPLVDQGAELPAMAVTYARMLQHEGDHAASAAIARRHLVNPQLDLSTRHFLCEMAAKSYEKLGEYDAAFRSFSESNQLKAMPFDEQEFVERIDDLLATFSSENLAKLPRARVRSDLPVFIASMPRSGSTLVEQIIHAHPKAFGAGEINEFQQIIAELPAALMSMQTYPACLGDFKQQHADELGKRYLEELREYDPRAKRITNKHLNNYRMLGMVELLLPGARIVHVKRDPLDNCFSIFMAQISTIAYPWAADLRNVGIAYKQYERIMAHWHDVLKIPILDVQYEDLVEDTETWIRKIIEFCGLPWDDRCLRYWEADRSVMTLSYDQVRKPIYKSAVKRYEKYDAFLGPLREVLASETAG